MNDELIKLRFESFQAFLDDCADRVSEQGIFLATDTTRPVGSRVRFELEIDSDFPILRGSGEVVGVVARGHEGAAGLALRYQDPEPSTVAVARQMVERQRNEGGKIFDLKAFATGAPAGEAVSEVASLDEITASDEITVSGPDEPVPISTLDLPRLGDPPAATPTQAVEALIVDADDDSDPAEAEPEEALELPPSFEPAAEPTPVLPWETDSEPQKSGKAIWLVLVLLVAGAGGAYWQRDALRDMFAADADSRPGAAIGSGEPVAEEVADATATGSPGSTETAAVEPEPAAAPAAPLGPISRVEEIRWSSDERGTVLELIADGTIGADGYSIERLVDPPRLVIKVVGVVVPLARPNLAIGSSEIVGVRTGLHGAPPDSTLHVVVDLADPTAEVGGASLAGRRLQVRVASGAVSP